MNETYPDAYYEGIAAWPTAACPYSQADLFHFCWFMAGYNDADRGMA